MQIFHQAKQIIKQWEDSPSARSELPEYLNLAEKHSLTDSDTINQYSCGNCWAASVIGLVNDLFAIKYKTNIPELSVTFALINYPQNQCEGGNPLRLLKDIEENGIPNNDCIDFEWCRKIFSEKGKCTNEKIPTEKSRCVIKSMFDFYFISDIATLVADENSSSEKIFGVQELVKKALLVRGPVLAGYFILENFKNGNFTKNNGVYIEQAQYNNDGEIEKILDFLPKKSGAHSVAVVGWGIKKNIKIGNRTANIPYWICRNSWGMSWGNNGYFNYAMYPWNRFGGFEILTTRYSGGAAGGFISCQAKNWIPGFIPGMKKQPIFAKGTFQPILPDDPNEEPKEHQIIIQ